MWTTLPDSLCDLGESPFWHPQERALYWLDIPGRAVLRTRGPIEAATVERWPLAQDPGCMAPARRGGLVIALRDGIYRARTWGGELVLLAPAQHDTATMRFNDGKCDDAGRFWAGTLHEPKTERSAALYCLDARGGGVPRLARMAGDATTANGLAFSPDARTLYWADTAAHAVRAWDWASEANTLSNQRVFRQFDAKPAGWQPGMPYQGRPDGATVDAEGGYWASMFEGAQLLRLAPSGAVLEALPVPVQCPTMPCFGGDDLRTLFVTSARRGRPADEVSRLPASGHVIHARVAVEGRPVAFFDD
jgi:sugar lactone lactonase YvrE